MQIPSFIAECGQKNWNWNRLLFQARKVHDKQNSYFRKFKLLKNMKEFHLQN